MLQLRDEPTARSGDSVLKSAAPLLPVASGRTWLPVSPLTYVEILVRHWKLIFKSVVVALFIAWLLILFLPKRFESQAKIKIRVGRESVALDPTVTTSQTLRVQQTREEEVISTLEILGSRQVASETVRVIGPDKILNGSLTESEPGSAFENIVASTKNAAKEIVYNILKAARIKDEVGDEELATMQLQQLVTIYAPKSSDVVTLISHAKSPELAQRQIEVMIDVFLSEHSKASATPGAVDFFETEIAKEEAKLNELLSQRMQFMSDNNLVSIEANRMILQEKLIALHREITADENALEQTQAEIDQLKLAIAALPEEIVAGKQETTSSAWSGIRQRVFDLQVQEKQYASAYSESHPKLQSVRKQLAEVKEILEQLEERETSQDRAINPERTAATSDMRTRLTTIAGLKSTIAEKKAQTDRLNKEVSELADNERRLIAMDRDIAVLESNTTLLHEKLHEAKTIEELQKRQLSNVSVVQPPTFIQRPVRPDKKLTVLGFAILGLFSGIGLSFSRELTNNKVRCLEQASNWFAHKNIYEFPEIRRGRHERANSQRARIACREIIADALLANQGNREMGRGLILGVMACSPGAGTSTLVTLLSDTLDDEFDLRTATMSLHRRDDLTDLIILRDAHEITLVDLPTLDQGITASAIGNMDLILLVVESEVTSETIVQQIAKRIRGNGKPQILGIAINRTRNYLPGVVRKLVSASPHPVRRSITDSAGS